VGACLNYNKLNGHKTVSNAIEATVMFDVPRIGKLLNAVDFIGVNVFPAVRFTTGCSCQCYGMWQGCPADVLLPAINACLCTLLSSRGTPLGALLYCCSLLLLYCC
jgi:hypothetical protein